MFTLNEVLVAVSALLLSYHGIKWIKNPLRMVPGPPPLPIVGNTLMINAKRLHMQLYDLAKKHGPVMKLMIFNEPVIILNSIDACLEAKLKRDGDFLGRPPLSRYHHIVKSDLGMRSFEDPLYPVLRHVSTSGLRAYGTGMAQLENTIQEVIQDMTEELNSRAGQPINSHQLCNSFVSSIMVFLLYGEKYALENKLFGVLHDLNQRMIDSVHPTMNGPILDVFPSLFKLRKYLFKETAKFLDESRRMVRDMISANIDDFKETFDEDNLRGCLDYFIKSQREEIDSNGNILIDDEAVFGLMANFVVAGMETSFASMSQAILDFVHDKNLVKQIQAQIDSNFDTATQIKHSDRTKLPLLEAYIHENLRLLSQAPIMAPHLTLRDTEVRGYKIPQGTQVIFNAFNTAHNAEVYPEPFECRPSRFLDEDSNLVPPGHTVRHNFIGFGAGARHCPGESFARTRIFLFLANILQKFDIEAAAEIPERDVREYDMGIILCPPKVNVKFTLRECVD